MRFFDFSSWHGVLTTLLGLMLVTLIGVGIRLLAMAVIQQRRERMNRQINERLRTLIAAYKVLGGSFTGNLLVDPTHMRDLRRQAEATDPPAESSRSDRARRIRDAVEASLSDIILLGTDEQVRLAAHAAGELAAGRPVPTAKLVLSLRDFIRKALDLEPIPPGLPIPPQGPARPQSGAGRSRDAAGSRGGGGGGGAGGGRAGMGMGLGLGLGRRDAD